MFGVARILHHDPLQKIDVALKTPRSLVQAGGFRAVLYTRDIFDDTYLPCVFDYGATHWTNVTTRFKGNSTRYYPKKSYNVKFPTANLFQGLKTVSFNAMYTDKSLIREHLAWQLFDDMGALASRPHFGTLAINGQVDQGSSANKGMRLTVGMVGWSDGPFAIDDKGNKLDITYDTSTTVTSQPALTMQLIIQTLPLSEGIIGRGVDELRWPRPVRPGDTLRLHCEIIDVQESKVRPAQGTVQVRMTTLNQDDQPVQTMIAHLLAFRRSGEAT